MLALLQDARLFNYQLHTEIYQKEYEKLQEI